MAKTTNTDLKTLATKGFKALRDFAATPPKLNLERKAAVDVGATELAAVTTRLAEAQREGVEAIEARYTGRREAMKTVLAERQKRLQAYAQRQRPTVPAEEGKFVVAGRVIDEVTGVGLPNVKVNAFDLDRKYDDRLGSARTDALGYYRIEYTSADFEDFGDETPETYIEVLDEGGTPIFTSTKSFVQKAGRAEFIAAPIDGNKTPASRALGEKVAKSVNRRTETFEKRKRILAVSPGTELGRLTPVAAEEPAAPKRKRKTKAKKTTKTKGKRTKAKTKKKP